MFTRVRPADVDWFNAHNFIFVTLGLPLTALDKIQSSYWGTKSARPFIATVNGAV